MNGTTYIWAVVEKGREAPFEGPHNPIHHNMLVSWSRAHVLSFSVSISRTNRRQVFMSSQGMCISSVIPKWTAWLAVCIYNHICREHAAMTTSHFFSWAIFPTFWGHPSDLLQNVLVSRVSMIFTKMLKGTVELSAVVDLIPAALYWILITVSPGVL